MSEPLFQRHVSLEENYIRLLKLRREWELADRSGRALCRLCNATKDKHLPDGRCSIRAGSGEFLSNSHEDQSEAEICLTMIERLLENT